MCEIDKGPAYCSHLVDELRRQGIRGLQIQIKIVAHGAVHQGERMYAQVGDHVVLEIIKAEGVGDAGAEARLRGEAHGIVVADIQFDEFLIAAREVHPQEMLAALGDRTVQHLREPVDFFLQLGRVEI